ncbi:MAG: hypothetical protein ACK56I_36930, partial [bacterium]
MYLLIEGLAEHILVELAVRWEQNSSLNNKPSLRADILKLMSVVSVSKFSPMVHGTTSVSELLTMFSVGTERPKNNQRPPPHDTVYKPLRMYSFINPST